MTARPSHDTEVPAGDAVPVHRWSVLDGRNVARNTAKLIGANVASNALVAVRSLLMVRAMAPAEYGTWSLLSAVLGYANYADLGLNVGLFLTVPGLIGRGDVLGAERTSAHVLTATLLMTGAWAAILLGVTALPWAASFALEARILAVGLVMLGLSNYYAAAARVAEHWSRIAQAAIWSAAAATAAALVLVSLSTFTAASAVICVVAGGATSVLVLAKGFVRPPAARLDFRLVTGVLKVGLPIAAVPIAVTVFQNIDRWVVGAGVSRTDLGLYGLGATLGGFLYLIPGTLATVLFTRQVGTFGVTGNIQDTKRMVLPPLEAIAILMAGLAGAMVLALPVLLPLVAFQYAAAVPIATLQVIGNCLLFSGPLGSQYLISVGRYRLVLVMLGAAVLMEGLAVVVAMAGSGGIVGAARAVLFADLVYGGGLVCACVSLFQSGWRRQCAETAAFFAPFVFCLAAAYFLRSLASPNGTPGVDLARLAVVELLYLLVSGVACLVWCRVMALLGRPFAMGALTAVLPDTLVRVLVPRLGRP